MHGGEEAQSFAWGGVVLRPEMSGEALCSGKQKLCVLCMVEVKHCVPAGEKLCVRLQALCSGR